MSAGGRVRERQRCAPIMRTRPTSRTRTEDLSGASTRWWSRRTKEESSGTWSGGSSRGNAPDGQSEPVEAGETHSQTRTLRGHRRHYQVRGFEMSIMTLVEGDNGIIVIGPLISEEVAGRLSRSTGSTEEIVTSPRLSIPTPTWTTLEESSGSSLPIPTCRSSPPSTSWNTPYPRTSMPGRPCFDGATTTPLPGYRNLRPAPWELVSPRVGRPAHQVSSLQRWTSPRPARKKSSTGSGSCSKPLPAPNVQPR